MKLNEITLDEIKKVWNTELDCTCCKKNFKLGDMFVICADCYTLFLEAKKFMQNTHAHGSIRHIKKTT